MDEISNATQTLAEALAAARNAVDRAFTALERTLYATEEWERLQEMRKTDPFAIIKRRCAYAELGRPDLDPARDICPDCREATQ